MAVNQENLPPPSAPFKTKPLIANELKIHLHTLLRRLEKAKLKIPRGLIGLELQKEIYKALNCSDWDEKG